MHYRLAKTRGRKNVLRVKTIASGNWSLRSRHIFFRQGLFTAQYIKKKNEINLIYWYREIGVGVEGDILPSNILTTLIAFCDIVATLLSC